MIQQYPATPPFAPDPDPDPDHAAVRSTMNATIAQYGLWGAAKRLAVGERGARRLQETLSASHFLSYLLVCVQSVCVVLILGHQQLMDVLTDPYLPSRIISGMILFILLATVISADIAVMKSFRRLGALRRNRQWLAYYEHWAYILFVLGLEGVTLGMVIGVSESNREALLSPVPLIAVGSLLWVVQIVSRAFLLGWTILQLFVVVAKLAPQLETLFSAGKEVLGGQSIEKMDTWDVRDLSLGTLVKMFAIMDRRPKPYVPWPLNYLFTGRRYKHVQAQEDQRVKDLAEVIAQAEKERIEKAAAAAQASVRTNTPPTGGTPATASTPSAPARFEDAFDAAAQESAPRNVSPMQPRRTTITASGSRASASQANQPRPKRTTKVVVRTEEQLKQARKDLIEEWLTGEEEVSTAMMKTRLEKANLGPISKSTINGLIHEIEEHKRGLLAGTTAAANTHPLTQPLAMAQ